MKRALLQILAIGLAVFPGQAEDRSDTGGGRRGPVQTSPCNNVPEHPFDLILGRPTSNAVTVSVLSYEATEGCIEFGTQRGTPDRATPPFHFSAGEPVEIVLGGLEADTAYAYRLRTTRTNSPFLTFHTARPVGSGFTFTITADSHLDEHTDCALYRTALANALCDAPDFHVDLGDTFMTEKHPDRAHAGRQYLAQRYYFGELCSAAPLFLALGNHDGESVRGRGEDGLSLALWANAMRKRHYPNPVPDDFFSGNTNAHPQAGLLQDYYAWTWGSAQFIVLDPFWYPRPSHGRRDGWSLSLGDAQYRWLARTLERSPSKFIFVFIHHLVGGADEQSRGGIEAAPFFEWGGRNRDGTDDFAAHRPGWPAPIHQLLVQHRVSAVFHGHDHLYVNQQLDGIVYQEVPQPASRGGSAARRAAEYGYRQGELREGCGHLRVAVARDSACVEFVRAVLEPRDPSGCTNRQVAHAYAIAPRWSEGDKP